MTALLTLERAKLSTTSSPRCRYRAAPAESVDRPARRRAPDRRATCCARCCSPAPTTPPRRSPSHVGGSRSGVRAADEPPRAAARPARHALRQPDRARRPRQLLDARADLAKLALLLRAQRVLPRRSTDLPRRDAAQRRAPAHGRQPQHARARRRRASTASRPATRAAPATCSSARRRATASTVVSVVLGDAERGARATPTRSRCCATASTRYRASRAVARRRTRRRDRATLALPRRATSSVVAGAHACGARSRARRARRSRVDRRCRDELDGPLPRGRARRHARACAGAGGSSTRVAARHRARASPRPTRRPQRAGGTDRAAR